MEHDKNWRIVRKDDDWDLKDAGMGILRFTLLFGLCAAALGLIAIPTLQKKSQSWVAERSRNLDPIRVGSTGRLDTYTVRKSVLQTSPNSVCIIRSNGTRSGEC